MQQKIQKKRKLYNTDFDQISKLLSRGRNDRQFIMIKTEATEKENQRKSSIIDT